MKKIYFLVMMVMVASISWGQVSINAGATPYTENFDALTTANFNLTNNTSITGVYAFRTTGNATPNVFTADNGGSNAGRFNNYGTTSASDRALGSASSGTPGTLYYGVRYVNNTGSAITSLSVTYTGEQWRNGGNATAQVLAFDYRQASSVTDLTTGTYTVVSALNFTTPTNSVTIAALDGNNAANRAVLTSSITVNIPAGEEIMLRWTDINDAGNDHGVAIDDLSVTATVAAGCSAPSTQASAITFSSVGINTMTVGWTNGDGLARIVVMNTTNSFTDPTDGTTPLPDPNYGGSGEQVVYNGNGNSVDITVLSPATTYWYRVYEYNCIALNTKYNISSATDNPKSQATLSSCASPLTQASGINFTAVAGNSMTVNWTSGNGSKRVVIVNTSNSFTDPVDGTDPTANTIYSGSGEQVIYNNTGSSVSVTGLSYGTTYWYRVYEYNCSGVNTKFNTSTATDNPLSQATTAAPALGLQLTAANTNYIIDFDNTVANVNNGQYLGTGFTTSPAAGQLNSNAWATTGMSDAGGSFGGSYTSGDFARGASTGGVTTGGFYAFTVGTGNNAFGLQPGGTDWTPGNFTLRTQNNTGSVLNSLGLAYKVYNFNDQAIAGSFNFSYSIDNVTYTPVPALDFTSVEALDASPVWKAYLQSTTITGLAVANGDYIYIRWSGDDVSGTGSRDEFALDDISIVANPTSVFQSFGGNLESATITGTTDLSATSSVAGAITLSGGNLSLGAFDLSAGSVTGGSASSYVRTNGTGALTVNNITTPAKQLPVGNSTYNPLQINNGSGFNWTARVEDAVNNVVGPFTTDKAINRTWHISPSATVVSAPDVTFNFDDADNTQLVNNVAYNGDADRTVQVWHYGNGSWTAAGTSLAMTPANGSQSLTLSGYTNFSPFAISKTSSPLPVTILSFAGQKERSVNVLRWSTANEFNNKGFEILRSTDGINYTVIGFVNSLAVNGNSSDILNYSFTDIAVSGTKQYYRLRQIDFDNRSNFSTIVFIKGERPLITNIDGVFPNPASSSVNVLIAASEREKVTLVVSDISGRVVSSKVVSVEQGSNTIPMDINQLNKGSYLIRLVCENGCNSAAKFMKL